MLKQMPEPLKPSDLWDVPGTTDPAQLRRVYLYAEQFTIECDLLLAGTDGDLRKRVKYLRDLVRGVAVDVARLYRKVNGDPPEKIADLMAREADEGLMPNRN